MSGWHTGFEGVGFLGLKCRTGRRIAIDRGEYCARQCKDREHRHRNLRYFSPPAKIAAIVGGAAVGGTGGTKTPQYRLFTPIYNTTNYSVDVVADPPVPALVAQ